MRILALIDDVYRPGLGGMQVVAQATGERMVQLGHEVTFLTAARDGPKTVEYHNGVRVVRYPTTRNPLAFVRAGIEATRALRSSYPFDVVHTHFAYAAIGPKAAIPPSVPRIRTYHGAWQNEAWIEDAAQRGRSATARVLRYALRYGIERHDLRRSETVFVLSETARAQVQRLDVEPSRIDVVPAGIDLDRFRPGDRVAARLALGLPIDRPLLLYVGRLVRQKGVHNLIDAMPLVRAVHPHAMLVVVGSGPERAALERLAHERGVGSFVRFMGHVQTLLPEHYRSADLCVVPSIAAETLALVAIEALACGTLVLGTPSGALVETLRPLGDPFLAAGVGAQALAAGVSAALTAAAQGAFTPERLAGFARPHAAIEHHASLIEQRCTVLLDRVRRHGPGATGSEGAGAGSASDLRA